MPDLTAVERRSLHHVAGDLHEEFAGIFGAETIEQLLVSSFEEMAAHATSANRFRIVLVERFARERLRALARVEGALDQDRPAVLFLCVHNAGRSQMALGWFTRMARSRAIGWSAGSMPVDTIDQAAVAAMAEVGIDISLGFSKPWTEEVMLAVDVVVTMGCGDACPLFPGKRYQDWEIEDPSGQTVEQIRPIRDQIGRRVADLLGHLGIPVEGALLGTPQPVAASTIGPITAGRARVAAVERGNSALSRRRRWRRGGKQANWS